MKIGILTQPLRNNYGGLLQNYALQQVLKGMGHEVETVDWFPEYNPIYLWLVQAKQWLMSCVNKDLDKPRYHLSEEEMAVISRNTHCFIERYIDVCPYMAHRKSDFGVIDVKRQYGAYVVGSDQVWRPSYNAFQKAMFLDFVNRNNVKRIAYAASFGTSTWELDARLTKECMGLLKCFDLITVREKSGEVLCKEYMGMEATHVLDPTMLLEREDYMKVVMEEQDPKSDGTLFYYILDPSLEKHNLIEAVTSEMGLQPFTIMPKCQAENRTKWDVKHRIEDCVFPSVTSWLRGFMDAEMVVVDSFHGAVFSIIFNKAFWVIGNGKRGNARFESLLSMFGLEDRMIETGQDMVWNAPIDWKRVNETRRKERNRCLELLKESLK